MVRLTLEIPGWCGSRPGQFALLQAQSSRCFLARAFSISDEEDEKVSFIIAPVGEGTTELCALTPGEQAWVLGPLGNGFDVELLAAGQGRTVIVGGGVGLAPFPLLLSRMREHSVSSLAQSHGRRMDGTGTAGREVIVLLGFREARQAEGAAPVERALGMFDQGGTRSQIEIVTEDGSRGQAEKVTDTLSRRLRPDDRVVVCGPEAMAKAAWDTCSSVPGVETWFSLETKMACGVGSCHGCIISLADGSYARLCRDGPVFRGEEVFGE
jgi:dihydroorotate dehydrogenase electron transfer subunit